MAKNKKTAKIKAEEFPVIEERRGKKEEKEEIKKERETPSFFDSYEDPQDNIILSDFSVFVPRF